LGLTLAGSKGQKGDELPRNGPSLCEIFFFFFFFTTTATTTTAAAAAAASS